MLSNYEQKILGCATNPFIYDFSTTNCSIYALSIGFKSKEDHPEDLKFTDRDDPNFSIFPSLFGSPDLDSVDFYYKSKEFPDFDKKMMMHTELYQEIHKRVEVGTKLRRQTVVNQMFDMGKFSVFDYQSNYTNEDQSVKYATTNLFVRLYGVGNIKPPSVYKSPIEKTPERIPDHEVTEETQTDQPLPEGISADTYSGEIYSDRTDKANADVPVFRGHTVSGYCVRAVYHKYCNGDPWIIKNVA